MGFLLSLVIPGWLKALFAGFIAFSGVGFFGWLKGRSSEAKKIDERQKVEAAATIVVNHKVADQLASAETDQEVYAALNADRQSDHR